MENNKTIENFYDLVRGKKSISQVINSENKPTKKKKEKSNIKSSKNPIQIIDQKLLDLNKIKINPDIKKEDEVSYTNSHQFPPHYYQKYIKGSRLQYPSLIRTHEESKYYSLRDSIPKSKYYSVRKSNRKSFADFGIGKGEESTKK